MNVPSLPDGDWVELPPVESGSMAEDLLLTVNRQGLIERFKKLDSLFKSLSFGQIDVTLAKRQNKKGALAQTHLCILKEEIEKLKKIWREIQVLVGGINVEECVYHPKKRDRELPLKLPAQPPVKKTYNRAMIDNSRSVMQQYESLYLEREKTADILIAIGDQLLYAHQLVLIPQSPYFANLLNISINTEKVSDREVPVLYPEIGSLNPEIMEKILLFLYTHELDFNIDVPQINRYLDLLECAQKLGIEELQKCFYLKLTKQFDLSFITVLFEEVHQKKLKILESMIRDLICLNPIHYLKPDFLSTLSFDSLIEILKQDTLSLEESEVADVIFTWVHSQPEGLITPEMVHQLFGGHANKSENSEQGLFPFLRLPLFDRVILHKDWKNRTIGEIPLFTKEDINEACNTEIRNTTKKREKAYDIYSPSLTEHSIAVDSLNLKNKILKVVENTPNYQIINDSFKISLFLDKAGNLWIQSLVDSHTNLSLLGPSSFILRIELSIFGRQQLLFFYPLHLSNHSFKQLLWSWPWNENLKIVPNIDNIVLNLNVFPKKD